MKTLFFLNNFTFTCVLKINITIRSFFLKPYLINEAPHQGNKKRMRHNYMSHPQFYFSSLGSLIIALFNKKNNKINPAVKIVCPIPANPANDSGTVLPMT